MRSVEKQVNRPASHSQLPRSTEPCLVLSGSDLSPESHCQARDLKLAWGAGFIDGDGCICPVIQRHRGRKTPSIRIRVVISQNDHFTLLSLKNILAERCSLTAPKRQGGQNRQPYVLTYDGKHAVAVIRKILPYLVRKSAEASGCLTLLEEGQLQRCPGPRGFPPEVHERRAYWVNRIRRMK